MLSALVDEAVESRSVQEACAQGRPQSILQAVQTHLRASRLYARAVDDITNEDVQVMRAVYSCLQACIGQGCHPHDGPSCLCGYWSASSHALMHNAYHPRTCPHADLVVSAGCLRYSKLHTPLIEPTSGPCLQGCVPDVAAATHHKAQGAAAFRAGDYAAALSHYSSEYCWAIYHIAFLISACANDNVGLLSMCSVLSKNRSEAVL